LHPNPESKPVRYRITHTTSYEYNGLVGHSYNEARLLPRECQHQHLISTHLEITPKETDLRVREDFFGNKIAYFTITEPHSKFTITAISEVEVHGYAAQLDLSRSVSWEDVMGILQHGQHAETLDARQYTLDSPFIKTSPELAAYAQPSFTAGRPLFEAANDLMQRIFHDFTFDPEFTTLSTPVNTVLEHKRGVCQDFAHVAIGCIRSMGLAARYVSGYIETVPPPGQEKLVGSDASHAWFSVYLPNLGWMDFDPTNNQIPGDQHIIVAWGRGYGDVTPLKGVVFGGKDHELKVSVDVARLGT
jgi:transglutaminase-like putative cysteine protease